jgi:hypothetical protein
MRAEQLLTTPSSKENIMASTTVTETVETLTTDLHGKLTQAYTDTVAELSKATEQTSRLILIGVKDGIILAFSFLHNCDQAEAESVLQADHRYFNATV